jgi:hypothetical protein
MRLLTDAILTVLRSDDFEVGDAQAPEDDESPYGVLYPLTELDRDGDMAKTDRTGWWQYSVSSVGVTRVQVQALADVLRDLIEDADAVFTVTGFAVGPVRRVITGLVERDDDVQPPLFYANDVFDVFVAPT